VKGLPLLLALSVLLARENPFVLPDHLSAPPIHSFPTLPSHPSPSPAPKAKVPQLQRDLGFIQFHIEGDRLVVRTRDPIKRIFTLDRPRKVVFDFAKSRDFGTKRLSFDHPHFPEITLGAHKSFYRVAIRLKCQNPQIDRSNLAVVCH